MSKTPEKPKLSIEPKEPESQESEMQDIGTVELCGACGVPINPGPTAPMQFIAGAISFGLCEKCAEEGIPPILDNRLFGLYRAITGMTGPLEAKDSEQESVCHGLHIVAASLLRLTQEMMMPEEEIEEEEVQ